MIFQQLEYFIAIADYHSINQAAEHLFISQQALRASLNSLERKLGFRLFDRSSKGMLLTEAGQAVYADAQQILTLSEGWSKYANPGNSLSGTVRITASTIICSSVLTDVVLECRKLYPDLNIVLYEAREDALLNLMSKRMIGILASAPIQVVKGKIAPYAEEKHLTLETYASDEFYIFLNANHPLAAHNSLTRADLSQLVLAIYPNEEKNFYYNQVYGYFSSMPPYHIQRQENIFQLIAENINVASVFPHLGVINNHYVSSGKICARPVSDFPMPGISCTLFPANTSMTPAEAAVSEMIRSRLNKITEQFHLKPPNLD